MSSAELVQAYRRLYRAGLRAIQYSKPARYTLRDQLRAAFRGERTPLTSRANNDGAQPFDAEAVRRTVWFLNSAAEYRGIEHKILKNLLLTAYWRRKEAARRKLSWKHTLERKRIKEPDEFVETAYDSYDEAIVMLNRQMRLCLR